MIPSLSSTCSDLEKLLQIDQDGFYVYYNTYFVNNTKNNVVISNISSTLEAIGNEGRQEYPIYYDKEPTTVLSVKSGDTLSTYFRLGYSLSDSKKQEIKNIRESSEDDAVKRNKAYRIINETLSRRDLKFIVDYKSAYNNATYYNEFIVKYPKDDQLPTLTSNYKFDTQFTVTSQVLKKDPREEK
ncbi:hypothetical protein [Eubacterium limosum]|uniref:hypothetical protein n=1 Tax=Eubacterium limosum TaxID=1736 RepID=UPI00106303BF|nr:hypothetical protein [Eubacterium limosum]